MKSPFFSLFLLVTVFAFQSVHAQYRFSGNVDTQFIEGDVYLSLIEDYRKISGVYHEQIIAKTKADSAGAFIFTGINLPEENKMYRIHADTCSETETNISHISGHCENSKEIVFVANNDTKMSLPFSFEEEMFCKVVSTDIKTQTFLKIDSLKNDMRYSFTNYRSEANRKVNTRKWFTILQEYGEQLNEPLAELYIYSFLSDRSSILHAYYLSDLKQNTYYTKLLDRLKTAYPDTPYTTQYEAELTSDLYLVNKAEEARSLPWWVYLIAIISLLSILSNFYFFGKWKKADTLKTFERTKLSNQEEKVLQLILDNKSNKEIASEIFVSVSTVKTHINNLYRKLDVSSRNEVKQRFL